MGFTVKERDRPWSQPESGPTRYYLATWDGSGGTSTALAKNAVAGHLFFLVEDQLTGIVRDLRDTPGTPEEPDDLGATEIRLRYMLHGYPISGIVPEEVQGTRGRVYEVTVTYSRFDDNAQAPQPFGVINQIVGEDTEASIDASRTLSASIRARELDYSPLIALLRRTPTTSLGDPIYVPPFPVGSVNAERTSLKGRVAVNGLKLTGPGVDYTAGLTITGAYPRAAWVKLVADAAVKGVTNSDTFTLGGISRNPGEILLVSAEFEASYNTSQRIEDGDYSSDSAVVGRMNLGFAIGERESLIVTSTSGTGYNQLFKSDVSNYVHRPSGEAAPLFYWQFPATPTTTTVGADQVFYVGPFDYIWRFIEDEQVGSNVISEVEWLSIHRPFTSTSFATLFGGSSL